MAKKKGKNQRASKETREADAFIQTSDKLIKWIHANRSLLIIGAAIFLIVGTALSITQVIQKDSEMKAQAALFKAENAYFTLKEKRDQAEADYEKALEDSKDGSKDKDKKEKTVATKGENFPSGDLKSDYGKEIDGLNKVMSEHKGSRASVMAAMTTAQIYRDYNLDQKADDVLASVQSDLENNDLLSGLVNYQRGIFAEKKGQCQSAIAFWKNVEVNKASAFLMPDVLLKQAICLEKDNKDKAKGLYQKVIDDFADSSAAKSAKTYLRLMKLSAE